MRPISAGRTGEQQRTSSSTGVTKLLEHQLLQRIVHVEVPFDLKHKEVTTINQYNENCDDSMLCSGSIHSAKTRKSAFFKHR